jgi:hypothetical protein
VVDGAGGGVTFAGTCGHLVDQIWGEGRMPGPAAGDTEGDIPLVYFGGHRSAEPGNLAGVEKLPAIASRRGHFVGV